MARMSDAQAERIAERIVAGAFAGLQSDDMRLMTRVELDARIRAALLEEPEATPDRTTRARRKQILEVLVNYGWSGEEALSDDEAIDAILALFPDHLVGADNMMAPCVTVSDDTRLLADFRWLAEHYWQVTEQWRRASAINTADWREHVAPHLAPQEEPHGMDMGDAAQAQPRRVRASQARPDAQEEPRRG